MAVEDARTIDFVAQDSESGEVLLVMVEARPWDSSDERLYELQEKLNTYVTFAFDELPTRYPALAGKRVAIELRHSFPPDSKTLAFLDRFAGRLRDEGFEFRTKPVGAGPTS